MSETIELPQIDAAMIDKPATPRTEVAFVAADALDLAKVDLAAVALAKFGDWRPIVKKLKDDNTRLVLDLSTQSKIDEAISLRQRTINVPKAAGNKVAAALKTTMAQASKKVGAELEALQKGYDEAGEPLTLQIDAAQKIIDDEKEAKRLAEEKRLQGLQMRVDEALAAWVARASDKDITSERIRAGIKALEQTPTPEWAIDVADAWHVAKSCTLQAMDGLAIAADRREEAARLEAQRLENERVAAENAAAAAIIAEARRKLEEREAEIQRQADAIKAALEARQAADLAAARAESDRLEQLAQQRREAIAKAETEEIKAALKRNMPPAEVVATAAADVGTEDTPDAAGSVEASPSQWSGGQATRACASERLEGHDGNPAVAAPGGNQSVPFHPSPQDAQESGFSPADAPACTSSRAEAADALPSGSDGTTARAEDRAAEPALGRFGHHPDPAIDFCVEVEALENESVDLAAGLPATMDLPKRIAAAMEFRVGGDLNCIAAKDGLRFLEADTASGAAPQQASDHQLTEAEAAPGMGAAGVPVFLAGIDDWDWQLGEPSVPATEVPIDDHLLFEKCVAFVTRFMQLRTGKFPSHPKPGPDWFASMYADGAEVLALAVGSN